MYRAILRPICLPGAVRLVSGGDLPSQTGVSRALLARFVNYRDGRMIHSMDAYLGFNTLSFAILSKDLR